MCGCDFVTYFNACQAENWYGLSDFELGACSGFPNYDITWTSNNSIDSPVWDGEIINLFAGDYTVSITTSDNASPVFGCEFETTVTVDSPEEFTYDFTVNNVSCFIDENSDGINDIADGAVTIDLIGGTPEYTTFALIVYALASFEFINPVKSYVPCPLISKIPSQTPLPEYTGIEIPKIIINLITFNILITLKL